MPEGNGNGIKWSTLDLRSIIVIIGLMGSIIGSYINVSIRISALEVKLDSLMDSKTYTKSEIDTWKNSAERVHDELARRIERLEDINGRRYVSPKIYGR